MEDSLRFTAELGATRARVDIGLARLAGDKVMHRIWNRDHSVWKPDPQDISNRLGWLDLPQRMAEDISLFTDLADEVRAAGYERVLLLGMGGSSLAPELYRHAFGVAKGYLDLEIMDTTDPATVESWALGADPTKTLWVVATKSGGTVETLSLLKYFYAVAAAKLGEAHAGEHFVAITDPGSKLAALAEEWNFRATIFGDPEVGGRFSALSPFGLTAAALLGVDLERLLERARAMAALCGPDVPAERNPAARLGVIMAELARIGRDKLTVTSPGTGCELLEDADLAHGFGDWVEQLVAESTGKEGRGILPIVGEPLGLSQVYGADRLFVYLETDRQEHCEQALAALRLAGHPVVRMSLHDPYDLGGHFLLWELATAVAGHFLQVNPFDQPDVESAKVVARKMVAQFMEQGELPRPQAALADGVLSVYGSSIKAETPVEAFKEFLDRTRPPEYVAIHAYLPGGPDMTAALQALRNRLRDEMHVAVTVGYGPRFLHSTGQLHKGDGGHGRFIQLTADDACEATIPDEMGFQQGVLSFGVLKEAQAMGDARALSDAGRKVIRFHLGADVSLGLAMLTQAYDTRRTSSVPPE